MTRSPDRPEENGVYAAPADAAALRSAVVAGGGIWRTADLGGVKDKQGLLRAVARALDFPQHFGGNWDALADSLEDLSWLGGSRIVLELEAASRCAHAAPDAWRTALDIFARAANYWRSRGRTFVVLVEGVAGLPELA